MNELITVISYRVCVKLRVTSRASSTCDITVSMLLIDKIKSRQFDLDVCNINNLENCFNVSCWRHSSSLSL